MRKVLKRCAVSLGLAAAAASATVGAGSAQAAPPHTVFQIPATALATSGLVVPGPYFANVVAAPTNRPGQTAFSAPAPRSICSSSAAGSLVRISYVNITTGQSGAVMVKPCFYYLNPTPVVATANTGAGQVVATIQVTGSAAYPNAGQPSLPGVATFAAR
ncbi:hypothetical protein VZC37_07645 [Gordonia sp. LSe1-13]|uniref:Uncharacterized protein n=1 Tax=Gordonia sesuvii TaxID=3116777 RepID=A0ABU7MAR7_9ACTN|nr:hypothetical protein [Gordonia sp. LSe1-13]